MGNGTMTVADIVIRVNRVFGDESAVQIQQADIIRWINDAQREAVMQHENLLPKEGTLDTVANTATYTLPADCFTLGAVYLRQSTSSSYYMLRSFSRERMDSSIDGWQGPDYGTATPQVYTRGADGTITLFPTPDASVTGGLRLSYSKYAPDVVNTTDDISIPAYYYGYVEQYCLMKAYEMDEDWESADKKAAFIQSTIDFNNNRDAWFGRGTYPTITDSEESAY
jgi:hypothetical protein